MATTTPPRLLSPPFEDPVRPAWEMRGTGSSSKVLGLLGADSQAGPSYTARDGLARKQSDDSVLTSVSPLASPNGSSRGLSFRPSLENISPTSRPRRSHSGLSRSISRPTLLSSGLSEADERDSPPPAGTMEGPLGEIRRPSASSSRRSRSSASVSSKASKLMGADLDLPPMPKDARARMASTASMVPRGTTIPSASGGSIMGSAATGEPGASGGQIEEIVPWLFQADNGRSLTPSSGLRHAESSRSLNSSKSDLGTPPPPEISPKKDRRGLFGLLKRKASANVVAQADSYRQSEDTTDASPVGFSNPFAGGRMMPTRQASFYTESKKPKKGKNSKDGPIVAEPSHSGFALDTDLEKMDGIVDLSGPALGLSVPHPRENGELGSPFDPEEELRRRGSGSPSGRRPSAAFSQNSLADSRNGSPMSDRSYIGRKSSIGEHLYSPFGRSDRMPSFLVNGSSADRRGSGGSGLAPIGAASTGWIAPESWAVADDALRDKDADSESDDNDDTNEQLESSAVLAPGTPQQQYERRESLLPVLGSNLPKTVFAMGTAAKRPTTGNSARGIDAISKPANYNIRVYKTDGTHTTISSPLGSSVTEMQAIVSRKAGFGAPTKGPSRLYARERGLERMMYPTERPLLLQKRRFEQAGYSEADKLEDLGREDHSYLIKFIYKPEQGPSFAGEDDSLDGFEYIDLHARCLTSVPIFLYRHAHEIVSLNLSKNPRLDLPSDFIQLCTSLRELRLAGTAMKRVPQSIRQATGLTRLDLSSNRIVELDHIALNDASELLSLKAHNNRLYHLPDYFGKFRSLKYLQISNNKFDSVPAVICEIASLVDLDISYNSIVTLPDDIGRLRNLERLIICSNAIVALPSSFIQLTSLRELDCRRNQIGDFNAVSSLPKLEVLRCAHNVATAFDLKLGSARVLNLQYNATGRLSFASTGLTLTTLNLGHGKLSSFPEHLFTELSSLEVLVLDNNSLRTLDPAVGELTQLQRFSIRCNNLDSVPESIGKLQRLQVLDVSINDLTTLPASIWQCGELVSLNASSNLMTDFPDAPLASLSAMPNEPSDDAVFDRKQSVALSVASKATTATSYTSARQPPPAALTLQRLYLADNQLSDSVFHRLTPLSDLRVLNLSFNELYEIPTRTLSKCPVLEELYLSGNMLTTLPEDDMERLTMLRILHINCNKLQTLPAELGTLKKLQVFDVGSNVLKYNIANWKYDWNWNWNLELRYLNLSGNKRLEIKPAGPQAMHNFDHSPGASAKRRNLSDFSALRKLRTLGLMDVTLMITTVPDDTEDRRVRTSLSEINDMAYGIADSLGQAGALASLDLVAPKFRGHDDEAVLGIFDARNKNPQTSGRMAKYLQDCFTATMSVELGRLEKTRDAIIASALLNGGQAKDAVAAASEDAVEALRRTFLRLNGDYGNIVLPQFDARRKDSDAGQAGMIAADRFATNAGTVSDVRSGVSGVVMYVTGRTLHVANAGDSLAVLSRRGQSAILISVKHEPSAPAEVARIRTAEGWISTKGLVNDELDVSRSFGHYHVFPALNACPAVTTIELIDDDEFVILANRAFWMVFSYQSAVDIARRERSDPMFAAQKLRDLAIGYGAEGNVMVMVLSVSDLFKTKTAPTALRSNSATSPPVEDNRQRRGAAGAFGERYLTLLDREVAPPTGSLAIVFTDIRNSTSLWDTNFRGMQAAMRVHNQLLRRQLRAIGGYEVKTEGDSFMVSFPTVTSALYWCFTVQIELLREEWPQELLDLDECREIYGPNGELLYRGLSIRMGVHWGSPVCEPDPITRRMDYFGPMVNRSARIEGAAEGGQICASADVVEIFKQICSFEGDHQTDPDADALTKRLAADEELDEITKRDVLALRKIGFGITELGERRLKGIETPEVLSLLYPSVLAGRMKISIDGDEAYGLANGLGINAPLPTAAGELANGPTEAFAPIPHLLDVFQIQQIGSLILRLEAAAASICQPIEPPAISPAGGQTISPATSRSPSTIRKRPRTQVQHPRVTLDPASSDEELFLLLGSFVYRVEHLISSLTLHQLGPMAPALAALSSVVQIDPEVLLKALSTFAQSMSSPQ